MGKDLEMLRELSLAEQLGRLHRLWRTVADLELAPLGLTHPRWTALWKLSRLGGHLSQKTLAEALEIELPSLMRTLGQLEERLPTVVKNKAVPVVLVCASGARANRAVAIAKKLGYENAQAMAGGLKAWREASLPVEKA